MKCPRFIGVSLFAILTCINFTSCESKAKKAELARQQAIEDSLRIDAEKKAEEKARIEKARIDVEALAAWGDAKFGMTPQEVKATNAFKNSEKYVKGTIMSDGRRTRSSISFTYEEKSKFKENMSLNVNICDFYAGFESEELTSIHLQCYNQSASYLDHIVEDAQILSYHFTKKYGKPNFEKSSVSIFDFDRGREFLFAEWKIGDKTAKIFMGEDKYDSSKYYYRVVIYNSNFPTKPDLEEQEAIKKYEEKKKQESANYF